VRSGRTPIRVTVVWATPSVQEVVVVELPPDATVAAAVERSGFVGAYGLDLDQTGYSVDGRRAWPATALADGSRVDLVRPLQVDPQTIRRLRAQARPLRPMSKPDRRRRV
jgi:putative ubiquitin-RnfH superfamily antitoxin RatB of RatAB toxin-antitoxin module